MASWRAGLCGICSAAGILLAACSSSSFEGASQAPVVGQDRAQGRSAGAGVVHDMSADAADNRPRVVVLGDSLTAGLGLSPEEAYPALLQRRIEEAGLTYRVINAGVSGDTTAGGLRRLDFALDGDVRVLIVALGGNDGLRGVLVQEMRRNLAHIIEQAKGRGISVVLAGMEAPPNFGQSYTVSFHQVYPELAKTYGVTFVPFLLDDVAGIDSLNQRDGIHPTADGDRIIAGHVWSALEPVLKAAVHRR